MIIMIIRMHGYRPPRRFTGQLHTIAIKAAMIVMSGDFIPQAMN